MPFHVSIELMNRTGHCKIRLDCRTKKKTSGVSRGGSGGSGTPLHLKNEYN